MIAVAITCSCVVVLVGCASTIFVVSRKHVGVEACTFAEFFCQETLMHLRRAQIVPPSLTCHYCCEGTKELVTLFLACAVYCA
jgi:hypothetical protein